MSRLQADYYEQNPLAEIAALKRRVAALERQLTARGGGGRIGTLTTATPEDMLPTAAQIPRLLLVDEDTREVFEIVARRAPGGRELVHLQRLGRLREPDAPEEGA